MTHPATRMAPLNRAEKSRVRFWPRRSAFTLIEIMLAVLLMALLASAAALSFSQPLQAARAQDAIESVRATDEGCRQVARRFGRPLSLSFDLDAGTLSRIEGDRATHRLSLPHGCRIQELRTAARRVSAGQMAVRFSPLGIARTYAVRLAGTGTNQWMLVSGISGEVSLIKHEAQLDAIFAATASRGENPSAPDAPGNDAD